MSLNAGLTVIPESDIEKHRALAQGMVTRLEEGALALYADLFVQYRYASEFVAKFGAMYAVPGRVGPDGKPGPSTGFRTYPQAERQRLLAGDLMRLGDRLGLTPASRTRLVGQVPTPAAPAFDHYFQPLRISP